MPLIASSPLDGFARSAWDVRLRRTIRWLCAVTWVAHLLIASELVAQKFPAGFFSEERVRRGEELARTYCASCHLLPAPDTLDRDTWLNRVMPWMMMVAGLTPEALPPGIEGELIKKSGAILGEPALKREEFGLILAHYLHRAPLSLGGERTVTPLATNLFRPRLLPVRSTNPMALLVRIREAEGDILLGDGNTGELRRLSRAGAELDRVKLDSPVVAVTETPQGLHLTGIGSFSPTEQASGRLIYVPWVEGRFGAPQALMSHLRRPTHLALADLNGDGRMDRVLSQFGWYSGSLSWFEQGAGGQYTEHVLHPKPGALRVEIRDMNGDGRPDIVALFAQAEEKMVLYLNEGGGRFTERLIFQHHPAFGHTGFELADMDGDGLPDIVATNGDNGDYPAPAKPYHGVRIYLNQGGQRFTERVFIPLPGTTKALARDFDGDGDLDLACIAYYPDYARARHEGFVYLENLGGLRFRASALAEGAAGRWLTMDAGDVDGDGDLDLVLGAVAKGPGRDTYVPPDLSSQWRESGATLLLLENLTSDPGKPK